MLNITKLLITHHDQELVNIAFSISDSLALVGQSGSGKSLTLKALLGILPANLKCSISYGSNFQPERGKNIGFVPQNPFTALSPLTKIKNQFFINYEKILELFDLVNLKHELLERYPPELSGGQLQRVVIAIALSNNPQLLLLDEPTTALDPQTRENIIALLTSLQKKLHYKMLFVTHDMQSAEALCNEIAVIKEGIIIETGKMHSILQSPSHDYTKTLIEANFAQRSFRK